MQSPITVRVGTALFDTTIATMQRCEGSVLRQLFAPPFPSYEPDSDTYVISEALCDAASFRHVLEYLRTGCWLPTASERELTTLLACIQRLRLDSAPVARSAPSAPRPAVKHLRVVLPLPDPAERISNALANTCVMISGLAYRGFCVVGEGPAPQQSSNKATEVLLRREVQLLPMLQSLMPASRWVALLHGSA